MLRRRAALAAAVSEASSNLGADRALREGLEAELAQMRSQVEWAGANLSATPKRGPAAAPASPGGSPMVARALYH